MNKLKFIIPALAIILTFSCTSPSTKNENMGTEHMDKETNHMNGKEDNAQTFNLDTNKLNSGDAFYQCEMHPEVLSDKTGNCPKCRMELMEIKKK